LALYALTYVKQLAFLSFSVGAVIAVVSLRYVMIARNTMHQPWSNATKHYTDLLQYMPRRSAVWHVYIRNDMAAVLAASVLVALEVVKELPITLMLRPADFETLATRVYSYANEGYYEHSYPAALLIVAVSAVLGGLYANNRHR
jgi:iron(III) transport system permease protein